jgi:hypothetical protein
MKRLCITLVFTLTVALACAAEPYGLTCEYPSNPPGIDAAQPVLEYCRLYSIGTAGCTPSVPPAVLHRYCRLYFVKISIIYILKMQIN